MQCVQMYNSITIWKKVSQVQSKLRDSEGAALVCFSNLYDKAYQLTKSDSTIIF